MAGLSKEEYLKRYLSGAEPGHKRTRRKRKVKIKGGGMRIVDDDVTWKSLAKEKEKEAAEDEDDEAPVVAEFIDERPEIVQQMEEFRLSNKWKILGDANEEFQDPDVFLHASQDGLITGSESAQRKKIETDPQVPERKTRRNSLDLSPPRRGRHDSPDLSPPRRRRHGSPDLSPPRKLSKNTEKYIKSMDLPPRRTRSSSPDLSPARCKRHDSSDSSSAGNAAHCSDSDLSPPRKRQSGSLDLQTAAGRRGANAQGLSPRKQKNRRTTGSPRRWQHPDSDLSPPRKRGQCSSDSDLSPPRRKRPGAADTEYTLCSDSSELSPARHGLPSSKLASSRGQGASWDMSPSRKSQGNEMLSGGQTGLISTEILRKEKEHRRQRERAADCFAEWLRKSSRERMSRMLFTRCRNRLLGTSMTRTWIASSVRNCEMETQWLAYSGRRRRKKPKIKMRDQCIVALRPLQTGLISNLDIAGMVSTDQMALNRNVMRDWQTRRLCRRLHTNGVWRTCKLLIEIRRLLRLSAE
ncbi:BUD13 homolog isoform X2 [Chiloscyllium plagiosum]|uniref:BUD13 homolog isoform X2 n=1 Tax=Chiloscyllium plagiosum TaxID=36176 RepID=UPI001CB7CD1E|nr:BUD13 homolog isoform X2 [Chiloscyllium plagiosum]